MSRYHLTAATSERAKSVHTVERKIALHFPASTWKAMVDVHRAFQGGSASVSAPEAAAEPTGATFQPVTAAAPAGLATDPRSPAQGRGQQAATAAADVPARNTPAGGVTTPESQQWQPGVGRVEALPALTSVHFSGDGSGSPALVGDQGFDTAAYAAYQGLFDVPGGRYPPPFVAQREAAAATASPAELASPRQQPTSTVPGKFPFTGSGTELPCSTYRHFVSSHGLLPACDFW